MNIFFRINFSGSILTSTHPYFLTILFSCFFSLLCNRRFTSWMVNYCDAVISIWTNISEKCFQHLIKSMSQTGERNASECISQLQHVHLCLKPLHSTQPTSWMLGCGHIQYMLGQVYIIYLLIDARPSFLLPVIQCFVSSPV